MVKGTKTHNLTQDVEPATSTSKPKRVKKGLTPDAVPSSATAEPKSLNNCHTPDVMPSTATAEPKSTKNCLTSDVVPSTSTAEPKTVKTCLIPDVEPSTSSVEPKTVKICCPQICSKCSKEIRRPKVSTVLSPVISPPPAFLTLTWPGIYSLSTHSPSPTIPFKYSSFSKTHMPFSPYSVELPGTY